MVLRLVNLTPHTLVFLSPITPDVVPATGTPPKPLLELPSSGVARVAMTVEPEGDVAFSSVRLPISRTRSGAVTGLPLTERDVLCVVSLATYQASSDRDDLVVVDRPVRDVAGRVIGARGLARPLRC